uniref:NADH dehydrogenase subunit 5 n=1 Tax=Cryptocephalus dimidiatipennis TaxID=2978450 RepID=UPI0021CCA75B|nr:NADH dehydrogenase subunit 5 [Cryptocephalus dimidiatipennis]UWV18204.1 NADH dehydrogenase subunit 5 [Cryptocephalus dimidiatipennis]
MMSFTSSLSFLSLDYILIVEFNLFSLNSSSVVMSILMDWMSLLFISFVMFISSAVILYSSEYMDGDSNLNRFVLLIVLFVMSMVLLIISPNLISILLGWDGLGLVSYCLVIYYQNVKSFNAGMLTALTNRIGDVALLMAIAWMMNYGSWNYNFYLEMCSTDYSMRVIGWLIILASITKSAQIPFSSWLPAAMAAPTPVSALVHSSTLVTAGVYLLIRFNLCFSLSMMFILLFLSSMTMFMAGFGANYENDLKKIIALSTLSQLGFMLSILSLGEWRLAFFHLLIHALFKALLFMCAGSIIHSFLNSQDIRYLGGLVNQMPYSMSLFNICNFSLCGLPFLSGFYSKDMIVEIMSMEYLNIYIYLIFYFSVGLTVSYTVRLGYYSLVGDYKFISLMSLSEGNFMVKGMSLIILFVVFSGSMLSWTIFPSPYFIILPFFMKMMTFMVIILGLSIGYEVAKISMSYKLSKDYYFSTKVFIGSMWNMPFISTSVISSMILAPGSSIISLMDQGWSEFYGSNFLLFMIKKSGVYLQKFSINHVKVYFLLMIIWMIFMIVLM